jgi:hypothetical protein
MRDNICSPLLVSVRDLEEVHLSLCHSWNCEVQLADDPHRRPLSDAGPGQQPTSDEMSGTLWFTGATSARPTTRISSNTRDRASVKTPVSVCPSAADMVPTYLRVNHMTTVHDDNAYVDCFTVWNPFGSYFPRNIYLAKHDREQHQSYSDGTHNFTTSCRKILTKTNKQENTTWILLALA